MGRTNVIGEDALDSKKDERWMGMLSISPSHIHIAQGKRVGHLARTVLVDKMIPFSSEVTTARDIFPIPLVFPFCLRELVIILELGECGAGKQRRAGVHAVSVYG